MAALSGRTAIVSGLSSEYVEPLITALASRGATLALVDGDGALAKKCAALLDAGATAAGFACDMSEAAIAATSREIAARFGTADILVTCPPARAYQPSPAGDFRAFREIVSTTLEPAFLWSAAVGPAMRARKAGVIVHLTGLAGLGGWRGWAPSGAAFAAINNLIQTLAVEYAADGVRVNGLVPGITASMAGAVAEASGRNVSERIPLGRTMTGDALGAALVYLVQPAASYVSGEILKVDGGWDMWGRLHAAARR